VIAWIWAMLACGDGAPAHDAPTNVHAPGGDHLAQMAATREELRAALGEAYYDRVAGLDDADLERGRALYAERCASCHGEDGKGTGPRADGMYPPPSDLTEPFHARFYSDAGRMYLIRNGMPGTAMGPLEGADGADLLALYAYVRTMRGEVPTGDVPPHVHDAPP
jgi:mono/diheme cytochrome c family protein